MKDLPKRLEEALVLIVQKRSGSEIAEAMGIEIGSVYTYYSRIEERLGEEPEFENYKSHEALIRAGRRYLEEKHVREHPLNDDLFRLVDSIYKTRVACAAREAIDFGAVVAPQIKHARDIGDVLTIRENNLLLARLYRDISLAKIEIMPPLEARLATREFSVELRSIAKRYNDKAIRSTADFIDGYSDYNWGLYDTATAYLDQVVGHSQDTAEVIAARRGLVLIWTYRNNFAEARNHERILWDMLNKYELPHELILLTLDGIYRSQGLRDDDGVKHTLVEYYAALARMIKAGERSGFRNVQQARSIVELWSTGHDTGGADVEKEVNSGLLLASRLAYPPYEQRIRYFAEQRPFPRA